MIVIGTRLQGFVAPGSMGAVQAMTFVNCFWPKLDRPTRLFADGSGGIKVLGTTPRNVWFPDDVEFLDYYPDALYPAEQAVLRAMPFRRSLVNLSPVEAQIWMDAYNATVATFPPTHTILPTPRHVNFLRHEEEKSRREIVLKEDSVQVHGDGSQTVIPAGTVITKIDYEQFVSDLLTPQECVDLMDGKTDEAVLRASKEFIHLNEVKIDGQGSKTPVTLDEWRVAHEAELAEMAVI